MHGVKASGWSIDKVLSPVYKIFDQSLSRRGDYELEVFILYNSAPIDVLKIN